MTPFSSTLDHAPFEFRQSETPLLVSMPHSGLEVPNSIVDGLTEQAKKLPDTDWYIPELYSFLESLGVGVIKANYSRYVIDLNRPIDDKPLYQSKTTGLFPNILFDEHPIFEAHKNPTETQRAEFKEHIWQRYHTTIAMELARLKAKFGYAILFDAHSIAAQVPMLFEGTLPDFNWGTNQGASCDQALLDAVLDTIDPDYSVVSNGRFKGGYITRHFGQPEQGIHAIQLELSQATYLNEEQALRNIYHLDNAKLAVIQKQLKTVIEACLGARFDTI